MARFFDAFAREFAECIAREPSLGLQSPRAFFVGGVVRDFLRGDSTRDCDIEVYGVPSERVREILEAVSRKPVSVFGAMFGIYSVSFDDDTIDVALPRKESKHGVGHKGFSISGDPYLSFSDALRRRDFTMNALLQDILTGEIIDPFGGRDDIVRHVLRVVDAQTFPEDPLRVFRGMQFVSRFGLHVDEATREIFSRMIASRELRTLSPERITQEWRKMLEGAHPALGAQFLEETGLLAEYPELDALRDIPQDPHWHPEGSVWHHVLRALAHVPVSFSGSLTSLRLAILLHDTGKARVTRALGGKIFDEGHAQESIVLARTFLDRFCFSEHDVQDVLCCVGEHERLPSLYKRALYEEWSEKRVVNELRMLVRDIGVARMPLYFALCEANAFGRDLPLDSRSYPVQVWAEDIIRRFDVYELVATPLFTGEDVKNVALRLQVPVPSGKDFGVFLQRIEDARDRGDVVSRNDALQYAEHLFLSK